jgi:hypothetical protein
MRSQLVQQLRESRRVDIETQLRINGFNTYG